MITAFGSTAKVFANPFTVFFFTVINILLNYYLKALAIQTKESSDIPNLLKVIDIHLKTFFETALTKTGKLIAHELVKYML